MGTAVQSIAYLQAAADVPLGTDGSVEPLLADDPWWLGLIKALLIFVILLLLTLFAIWFERKVVGRMQHRPGPNWNGPFGLLQSLADALKLIFKEGMIPTRADKFVFIAAPIMSAIPAFLIFSLIPIGGPVSMFGHQTALQMTDLPVGVLAALAFSSIGVYGIVLGGWASGSTYPLLGGLRSAAQLISYEVAMGLSFVAVFLYSGTLSTSAIVNQQAGGCTSGCSRCRSSSTACRWSARPTGPRSTWPRPRVNWSADSTPSTPRCASGCS